MKTVNDKKKLYLKGIKGVSKKVGLSYLAFTLSDFENINDLPHFTDADGREYLVWQVWGINVRSGAIHISTMLDEHRFVENNVVVRVSGQSEGFMEELYRKLYNYFVGENEMTDDEFLENC